MTRTRVTAMSFFAASSSDANFIFLTSSRYLIENLPLK